jgi:hypothetical protein
MKKKNIFGINKEMLNNLTVRENKDKIRVNLSDNRDERLLHIYDYEDCHIILVQEENQTILMMMN